MYRVEQFLTVIRQGGVVVAIVFEFQVVAYVIKVIRALQGGKFTIPNAENTEVLSCVILIDVDGFQPVSVIPSAVLSPGVPVLPVVSLVLLVVWPALSPGVSVLHAVWPASLLP